MYISKFISVRIYVEFDIEVIVGIDNLSDGYLKPLENYIYPKFQEIFLPHTSYSYVNHIVKYKRHYDSMQSFNRHMCLKVTLVYNQIIMKGLIK